MLAALLMLFYVWLRSRQKLLVAAGVVVIVAAVWLAMPLQYKDRFITTFDLERNPSAAESARGRITGLKVGAEMFFDRPLLGVGIGNFSAAHAMLYSPSGSRSWLQAHNLLAQVAGETGLLGVIAFAGFVIASMRLAGRLSSTPRSALPGWAHGLPVNAGAQQLPGSVSLIGSDDSSFVSSTARAALACIWLLLFLGLFAHNLLRFNWYLNAGLISACGAMMPSLGAGHEKKRVDLRPPRAELPRAETPEV
jgi:O-antigen ligase